MFFRLRVSTVILFSCILFAFLPLEAAWWDIKGQIPVPPQTKEVKAETDKLKYQEFDFTHYESRLEAEQIVEFYHEKLPVLGWQETNPLDAMGKIEGAPSGKNKSFGENLVFRKGGELIVLRFVFHRTLPAGIKTRYILAKNTITKEIKVEPDIFSLPAITNKFPPDIAPVYPGAKLIGVSEKSDSSIAAYVSRDNEEDIIYFYKNNLGNFGWRIKEEIPSRRKDFVPIDGLKEKYNSACPACPETPMFSPGAGSALSRGLSFTNPGGDFLYLSIIRFMPRAAKGKDSGYITISVKYDKKK